MRIKKPYTNKEYFNLANYCNENGCHIVDSGDYLESEKNQITPEEQKKIRILELKQKLCEKDYIGVKIATGCATIEEYSEEIAQCELWRQEIRNLENETLENSYIGGG